MQGKQPGRRLAQSWPLAPGLGEGHVLRHQGSRINGSAEERGEFSFLYFHLRRDHSVPRNQILGPEARILVLLGGRGRNAIGQGLSLQLRGSKSQEEGSVGA